MKLIALLLLAACESPGSDPEPVFTPTDDSAVPAPDAWISEPDSMVPEGDAPDSAVDASDPVPVPVPDASDASMRFDASPDASEPDATPDATPDAEVPDAPPPPPPPPPPARPVGSAVQLTELHCARDQADNAWCWHHWETRTLPGPRGYNPSPVRFITSNVREVRGECGIRHDDSVYCVDFGRCTTWDTGFSSCEEPRVVEVLDRAQHLAMFSTLNRGCAIDAGVLKCWSASGLTAYTTDPGVSVTDASVTSDTTGVGVLVRSSDGRQGYGSVSGTAVIAGLGLVQFESIVSRREAPTSATLMCYSQPGVPSTCYRNGTLLGTRPRGDAMHFLGALASCWKRDPQRAVCVFDSAGFNTLYVIAEEITALAVARSTERAPICLAGGTTIRCSATSSTYHYEVEW